MLTVDLGSENALRLGAFISITLLMIVWEVLLPRRRRDVSRRRRWPTNFGLGALNAVMLPIVMPLVAIEMAIISADRGSGLLAHLDLPVVLSAVLFVLAFDFTIYWQHRIFHIVPPLWRLHRVHHIDREIDVSTAVRFHPLSIILSFGIKLALIAALGPPAVAVLIAEVLLNVTSMFNHANVYIPECWDKRLRWFIVTPDMHRIHHSTDPGTRDHDFGFNFTIWDRLFGSYLAQAPVPQEEIETGVPGYGEGEAANFMSLLWNPFKSRDPKS